MVNKSGKNRGRERQGLKAAFVVSVLFHLLFLPAIPPLLFSTSERDDSLPQDEVVYLVEDFNDASQIVDVVSGERVDRPLADSSFLSSENRRVDRQTQARQTGPQTPQPSRQRNLSQEKEWERLRVESAEGGRAFRINTDLPEEFLAKLSNPAPSNYLPNIAYGEQTLLDTKEYAFAHFYIRMKREMEYYWRPMRVLERRQPDYQPEYRTVLKIVLGRDGVVKSVKVISRSTIDGLDAEAVQAVKKAAPFENPPEELVGADGNITIDHWHFIVTQRRSLF